MSWLRQLTRKTWNVINKSLASSELQRDERQTPSENLTNNLPLPPLALSLRALEADGAARPHATTKYISNLDHKQHQIHLEMLPNQQKIRLIWILPQPLHKLRMDSPYLKKLLDGLVD